MIHNNELHSQIKLVRDSTYLKYESKLNIWTSRPGTALRFPVTRWQPVPANIALAGTVLSSHIMHRPQSLYRHQPTNFTSSEIATTVHKYYQDLLGEFSYNILSF